LKGFLTGQPAQARREETVGRMYAVIGLPAEARCGLVGLLSTQSLFRLKPKPPSLLNAERAVAAMLRLDGPPD